MCCVVLRPKVRRLLPPLHELFDRRSAARHLKAGEAGGGDEVAVDAERGGEGFFVEKVVIIHDCGVLGCCRKGRTTRLVIYGGGCLAARG
jgi:hypothetical protein